MNKSSLSYPSKHSRSLPFLFPFVFWFSLSVTVLFRQYLRVLSFQDTGFNRQVRVTNAILSPHHINIAKGYIYLSGIKINLTGQNRYKSESDLDLLGKQISATGTLTAKTLKNKFSELELDNAEITVISTRLSPMQRAILTLNNLAYAVRERFVKSLVGSYSYPEASLVAGMLLGVKDRLSYEHYRELQQSGLLHLVAASGYNISIVIGVVGTLIAFIVRNNPIKLLLISTTVSIYIFIAGAEASVIRAGIMGIIGFLALQRGSRSSSRRIFVFVALLMLIFKPSWLFDLGYQLSVAATCGLLWIDPQLKKLFGLSMEKKYAPVRELTTSISASLSTLPIIIINLGWARVSLAGILVNIPAGMLVTPIMAVGVAVGLLGMLFTPLARAVAILGRPVTWGMIALIKLGAWLNNLLITP